MTSKVIIVTGGTGGIGYQVALALPEHPAKHTIVVTGRSRDSAEKVVLSLKEATGNDNIHYATADLKLQSGVKALAKDLSSRFPKIDELVHNARNLSHPFDTVFLYDWEATDVPVGVQAYSVTKRVMECMAVALSRELEPQGIAVNVLGGALPGATSMTSDICFKDMPLCMKAFYQNVPSNVHRVSSGLRWLLLMSLERVDRFFWHRRKEYPSRRLPAVKIKTRFCLTLKANL
jgi:NAD(P)-dependent dehydrogenase (short-subunit alcohol dehydrogenase family)